MDQWDSHPRYKPWTHLTRAGRPPPSLSKLNVPISLGTNFENQLFHFPRSLQASLQPSHFNRDRLPHSIFTTTTRNKIKYSLDTKLTMTTFTNSQRDVFTTPPDVHRPNRVFHASTNKSRDSLASVDMLQEERENQHILERSEPMSSVHFLLAHQPSRPQKPGHIVERKREYIIQITNAF